MEGAGFERARPRRVALRPRSSVRRWRLTPRLEFLVQRGDVARLEFTRGLLFAEEDREVLELCLERGLRPLAVAEAEFEFAFG